MILIWRCLLWICLGSRLAVAQPPAGLTREQAVGRALAQLSTYTQAVANSTLSHLDVAIAEAAVRPKWEIVPTFTFTSPSLGPNGPSASFVSANGLLETMALVRLRGELDTSGLLALEIQRTQALQRAAAAGSLVARQNLVLATEQAYYSLALASARVAGARQNLAYAEESERVTRLLLKAGEVPGVDLQRVNLQIRDRQAELENQSSLENGAREALRSWLGSSSDPLETVGLAQIPCGDDQLGGFRPELIERRPELAQFDAQVEAFRHEADGARSSLLPRLTYSLGLGVDSSSLQPQGLHSSLGLQAMVALVIPLDDGGVAEAREKQALVKLEQVQAGRALALRQFSQLFESSLAQARAAVRRSQLGGENLAQAETIFKIALARYRAGEARIIEVTDAQNALAVQRLNWLQALADYQLALAQLRYSVALGPEVLP